MSLKYTWVVLMSGLLYSPTFAAEPVTVANTALLSSTLRDMLLKNLPDPIIEAPHNWGTQREVNIGIRWERKGAIRFRPSVMRDVKNDGHWQKVKLHAIDPTNTLSLKISNIRTEQVGQTLFDAAIGMDVRMIYEQQLWKMGKRAYAGETRAKANTLLQLTCELTEKFETPPGGLLPDVKLRIRVTSAALSYDNLVCEHTLGVGGDAAKLLGKACHEVIKKVKPDLETNLLTKANEAIIKAGDTKEVKIELSKLLQRKTP